MKPSLEQIKAPIADELNHFEKKFRSFLKTDVLLLDKITNYVVKSKGKQMRPMFVFLTAGLCGTISEATHRGASLVELLHTATLVHDDVVDDASYRRGFFSVNALWKNKIAVLVGDYFLARGLLLSIDNDDFALLRLVSQAVREMSEGELLQMEKARRLDIDESVYFEIIRQKTATLIAACCGVGAASAGANPEIVAKMQDFGEKIGIAFQIKDDLFDYGSADIGKPIGIDIKERKMTLPLIYSLTQASTKERRHILYLLKNKNEESATVKEIVQFVRQKGGLDYAKTKMQAYRNQAEALLEELPHSDYKAALLALVAYAIEREK
jgi:octaprenyl-diphosphate synthase